MRSGGSTGRTAENVKPVPAGGLLDTIGSDQSSLGNRGQWNWTPLGEKQQIPLAQRLGLETPTQTSSANSGGMPTDGDVFFRTNLTESLSNDVDYVAEVSTRRPDALVRAAAADREYYDNAKSSATNAAAYIGWHFGGLLNETGYELAKGGRSFYRFGTDANTRATAFRTVNYALSNPGVVADGIMNGVTAFANKPFSEQADSLFKFGAGSFATAGAGKLGMFAARNTVAGAGATFRFVAPKAGELLENYMMKTGSIAYAVEPGPSMVPRLDISSLTPKEIPSFRSGKFNDWFDSRTPDEIGSIYENAMLRDKVEAGLRGVGGKHEFLMVAEAPHWSKWGVSAKMVQDDFAVPISMLNEGGLAKGWAHSTGLAGSVSPGSKMVHNQLQRIIQQSNTLPEFKVNIAPWADKWITGGYNGLPPGFQF